MSDYEQMSQYIASPDQINQLQSDEQNYNQKLQEAGASSYQQEEVQQTQQPQTNQRDNNFRALEQQRDEERIRREYAEQRMRELEYQLNTSYQQQQYQQKIQQQHYESQDDDIYIDDDTYVEGKQVKQLLKKLDRRMQANEEKYKQDAYQAALQQADVALCNTFGDFKQVVTTQNLRKLEYEKPSLYRAIMSTSNVYDQGYTAYEILKQHMNQQPTNRNYPQEYPQQNMQPNPYQQPNHQNYQQQYPQQNQQIPRSSSGIGARMSDSPMTGFGDGDRRILNDNDRSRILNEMREIKMRSNG